MFQNPTPFAASGKGSIKMESPLSLEGRKSRVKLEPRDESAGEKTDDEIDGADEPLSPSSKNDDDKGSELSLKQSLKRLKHELVDEPHDLSGEDEGRSEEVSSE